VFIEDRMFLSPRLHQVVLSPARSVTILRRTMDVTRYAAVEDRVVNHGLDVQEVERITKTKVHRSEVKDVDRITKTKVHRSEVKDVDRPALVFGERGDDDSAPAFRPKVRPAPQVMPTPPIEDDRRRAAEELILQDDQNAEIEELDRRQRLERDHAQGDNLKRLQKQHNDERKALLQQQSREKQQLRNR
jgi:hypothetical protein